MVSVEQRISEERYKLIPRTLIFLTRNDQLLLIKGSADKNIWANRYNGIGGHIECGENIFDSARRELREETGLIPDTLWLSGIVTVNTGLNTGIGIFIFRGECLQGEPKKSEEGDLIWIKFTEYPDLPLVEDLYSLLPTILAMRKEDPPFIAHTTYNAEGSMLVTFADLST